MKTILVNEFQPFLVPKGLPIPINIYIYASVGKTPRIEVDIKNDDGSQVFAPLIVPTKFYDVHGFVNLIQISPDTTGGVTTENFVVNIKSSEL